MKLSFVSLVSLLWVTGYIWGVYEEHHGSGLVHQNHVIHSHIECSPLQIPPTAVMDRDKPVTVVSLCVCVNSTDVCIGIAVAHCGLDACWLYEPLIPVPQNTTTPDLAPHGLRGPSGGPGPDDLMLLGCNLPQSQLPAQANIPLQAQLQGGDPRELWGFGSLQSSLSQLPATGKLVGCFLFLLPVNLKLPH